jgi:hypothetical protein
MVRLLAFVVVTLLPGIILAIPALLSRNLASGIWLFTTVTKVAVVVSLVGALPILLILHVSRARRLRYYVLGGIALGLALSSVLLGPGIVASKTLAGWPSHVAQVSILVILTVIPAFIYWIFVRPDKADASDPGRGGDLGTAR